MALTLEQRMKAVEEEIEYLKALLANLQQGAAAKLQVHQLDTLRQGEIQSLDERVTTLEQKIT